MFGENNIESESTYRDSLDIADRYPHCSAGLIFCTVYKSEMMHLIHFPIPKLALALLH